MESFLDLEVAFQFAIAELVIRSTATETPLELRREATDVTGLGVDGATGNLI